VLNIILAGLMISTTAFQLPKGYEETHWGMTIEELTSHFEVHKAVPGSEYSYADHTETDPDVYIRLLKDNQRIEYYFYEGMLYKIYVIYDRAKASPEFYQQRIEDKRKLYGPAQSHYQEKVFGILVLHVKWDDGKSSMDLRSGAGYIYEVYVDKGAERKKASQIRKKKIQEKSI